MPFPHNISGAAAAAVLALLAGCSAGNETARKTEPAKPANAPENYRVKLDTSKGDVVIEVTRAWAPRAADRFYELVTAHYFDGVRFYRVLPRFVAQFGVSGDPALNRLWTQMKMPDDPRTQSNKKGTVSFAMAGPASRTTEVFINLADNGSRLDKSGFAPFGKVVSGMDAAESFYKGYGDRPPAGVGPDHDRMINEGHVYTDRLFPRLDYIRKAALE